MRSGSVLQEYLRILLFDLGEEIREGVLGREGNDEVGYQNS